MERVSTFLLGVSRNAYFIDEGVFTRMRDNNFIFNEETINIWKDEKKNE